jgi:hypothetical protein
MEEAESSIWKPKPMCFPAGDIPILLILFSRGVERYD